MMILSLTFKGLLILIVAWMVLATMHKRSPAQRLVVWTFAFTGLLLLPGMVNLLPAWYLVPVANERLEQGLANFVATPYNDLLTSRTETNSMTAKRQGSMIDTGDWLRQPGSDAGVARKHSDNVSGSNTEWGKPNAESKTIPTPLLAAKQVDSNAGAIVQLLTTILTVVWGIGFVVLAARLLLSNFLLCRMEHNCPTLCCQPRRSTGPTNYENCHVNQAHAVLARKASQLAGELKLKRAFRLIFSDTCSTPFVWGVFKPGVVLPDSACMWDESKFRSVLAHELAHIQRKDPFFHMLVQLTVALHWINPLVWFAARRVRHERELACDDRVLNFGIGPAQYARHLLEISSHVPDSPPAVSAIAMGDRTGIRSRMERILADEKNRRASTVASSLLGLVVIFSIAVPVSMATMTPKPVQQQSSAVHEDKSVSAANELFLKWWSRRRLPQSNNIPSSQVKLLGDEINAWVSSQSDPTQQQQKRLQRLLELSSMTQRTQDWNPSEAKALVFETARLAIEPIDAVKRKLELLERNTFSPGYVHRNNGTQLLVWSETATNGLRIGIELHKSDATRKHIVGSKWRRSLWLHNTSDQPILVSTPGTISIEALNLSVTDSDGKPVSVVAGDSHPNSHDAAPTINRRLGPNEKIILGMKALQLGRNFRASDGKPVDIEGDFIDVSRSTDLQMTFCPELLIGDNPLIAGPSYSLETRKTLFETMLRPPVTLPNLAPESFVKLLFIDATGSSVDKADVALIKELINSEKHEEAVEALARLAPEKSFTGKLAPFTVKLSVESISRTRGEQELEKLYGQLFEWDRDRRDRIVAANDAGRQDEITKILNEDLRDSEFERMMQLAEVWPESETAMEASLLTMKTTYGNSRDVAMNILVNHHVESSLIARALPFTKYTSQQSQWAKKILKQNSSPVVVAHAKWAIGPPAPQGHEPEPEEAIDFYCEIIRDFGNMEMHRNYWGVPSPRKTFGELATREIQRIKAKSKWTIGTKLPDFEGVDLDGKPVSLADYKGKTTLIVYWTTWCGPCLQMAKMEKRMLDRYEDQPFDILGVCGDFSLDDLDSEKAKSRAQEIRAKAKQHGIKWRSIRDNLDGQTLVSELLGFPSLPYTLLIDGDGIVRSTNFINGTTNDPVQQEKQLMREIEKVLGGEFESAQHVSKIERKAQALAAYRRVQPKLEAIESSVKDGDYEKTNLLVKELMADDSAPLLKPFMLNRVNWTLYLIHAETPLPEELLATLLDAAEMAVADHPNDTYLLGTLAHVLHATGDLQRAIEILKQAIEYSDEESGKHPKAAMKQFQQELLSSQ